MRIEGFRDEVHALLMMVHAVRSRVPGRDVEPAEIHGLETELLGSPKPVHPPPASNDASGLLRLRS